MITDEMLKEAAGEVERHTLENLPEEHVFSDSFERRVNRAKRRTSQPVLMAARGVAAVLVVCLAVFGILFAAVPSVRASVGDWYKSDYFDWAASGRIPVEDRVEYCLTYIPEGYDVWGVMDIPHGKAYLYANSEDKGLSFEYWYDGNVGSTVKGYTQKTVSLGDVTAEIFLSPYENKSSGIFWKDANGDVAFSISAFGDEELLIQLALSVEEKK